ncbi:MAG: protein-glutamate O-methyltransferase CheR [Pseudomonadota bacterium]|nr:protein-glutamate O-methyltransferase CheR [Pseudomonadota bacterium]
MALQDFENLLQRTMGLDTASIGTAAVESAIKTRLSACQLADLGAYWEFIASSPAELQRLIEAIVVPETWFFRDREAFGALAQFVVERWLPAYAGGTLRLLSLPCSSGEEAYTMSMALLDAGFPSSLRRIDAVDISHQALRLAENAVYGRNSFRGEDLAFRERHFAMTAQGYLASEAVREGVHFQHGNLLADDFLPGTAVYDGIFCRNLLIYFDRETQKRAVLVLQRLLKPDGILFVGPAEYGLVLDHDFVSAQASLVFGFRRRCGSVRKGSPASAVRPIPRPPVAPTSSSSAPATPRTAPRAVTLTTLPASIRSAQQEAFRLADQGRFTDASKRCAEDLCEHGPSAQTYFLMGLIRAAGGALAKADEYYRKALYLDRDHQDTLAHRVLLLEKLGQVAGARVLRERLRRLLKKEGAA